MRNLKIITASAAALAVSAMAMPAAAQLYGTIGYTQHSAGQVDLGAVTGRVGMQNGPIGFEFEGGFGVKDDRIGATKVELKRHEAVYATVGMPLNETIGLNARVGVGNQQYRVGGADDSESSLNYGAGATFMLNPNNGLKLDYTRVDFRDSNRDEGDNWTASFVRKF